MSNIMISMPREHLEVLLRPEPGRLERYETAFHELRAILESPMPGSRHRLRQRAGAVLPFLPLPRQANQYEHDFLSEPD